MQRGTTAVQTPAFVASYDYRAQEGTERYFDYARTVARIAGLLSDRFGCEFKRYDQADQGDVWDGLAEDIESDFPGLVHLASVFDLVESRQISFEPKLGETIYRMRPSVRNNLFVYPEYRVALVRMPMLVHLGLLATEDLIFAPDDEQLSACLQAIQLRRSEERKMHVYTDTREGLQHCREPIAQALPREDVMMDDTLKQQIFRSVDEFFGGDRTFFEQYQIPYKRGILLYGKPGNGKTTLVKSIAGSVESPVFYWQITEYTNSESIREVFAAAVKQAPSVLVIEDIDSMPDSCRSFFLNILDGATAKEGVFLIGTTNYPQKIDPALINRAGRFDRAYEVKLPDEALRLAYLRRKGLPELAGEEQAVHAAERTQGFSLAQLNELYVSAALQKRYDDRIDLEQLVLGLRNDLDKARKRDWLNGTDWGGASNRIGFQ